MGRGIPSAFARRRSKKPRHVPADLAPAVASEPAPEAPAPEPVVEAAPAPVVEAAPAPEPEPAPEPAFSMSNTKKQLLAEAQRLDLDVGSSNTKAQILDAILSA